MGLVSIDNSLFVTLLSSFLLQFSSCILSSETICSSFFCCSCSFCCCCCIFFSAKRFSCSCFRQTQICFTTLLSDFLNFSELEVKLINRFSLRGILSSAAIV